MNNLTLVLDFLLLEHREVLIFWKKLIDYLRLSVSIESEWKTMNNRPLLV